jgi:HEPN domain-containing protein
LGLAQALDRLDGLKVSVGVPQEVERAVELTRFAWQSRYPGVSEPIGTEGHREAVQIAEAVVRWAGRIIGESS